MTMTQKKKPKDKFVSVRYYIPPEQKKWVKKQAEKEEVTESFIIRSALDVFMDKPLTA